MMIKTPKRLMAFSALLCIAYLVANTLLMGFSLSTILVTTFVWCAFNVSVSIQKLVVAFLPIILFVLIYDFMRVYPNYMVNPIDTKGLYDLEMQLFGFNSTNGTLIPSEYFNNNHWLITDILSGIFYLCWVPLPIVYGLYLYFTKQKRICIRFTSAFLLVNLIGFAGYYIHPAAPPWYVMQYGFVPDFSIGGHVAGFARFDEFFNCGIFNMLYCKNSNVFAAVPSMHSAYVPVALYYAFVAKQNYLWIAVLLFVSVGIWFSAVYSGHHYIIDVILGALCAVIGLLLFEFVLLKIKSVSHLYERVANYLD